jgi:hypothetical protein
MQLNFERLKLVLIPFVLSQIILDFVLSYSNVNYFLVDNWIRFDSGHYIQIAKAGYEYFPCAGKFGYPVDSTEWCGNTGWFPGYPLFIKIFALLFRDYALAAVIVSKIFSISTIWIITLQLGLEKINLRSFLLTSIAYVSFGFIYFSAAFPISGTIFWIILAQYSFFQKRYLLSFVGCLLAAYFYPTGLMISVVLAMTHLLFSKDPIKNKIKIISGMLLSGAIGLGLVFATMYYYVSDWWSYFKVSAKYGNHLHNPINSIIAHVSKAFSEPYNIVNFKYYQTGAVIVAYLILTTFFWVKQQYRDKLQFSIYLTLTIYLFFPWSVAGDLSSYRSEALLLPFIFTLTKVSNKWLIAIVVLLLVIGMPISHLFFKGLII